MYIYMCVVYECIIYIYKYTCTCTYKLQLLRAEEKDVHCKPGATEPDTIRSRVFTSIMPIRRKATVDAKGLVFSTPDSSTPSECVFQQGLGRIGEKKKHFCTKDRLSVGRENLTLISQVNSTPLSRSFFGLTVDEALIEARPNCRRNLTEVSSIAGPTSIWPSKSPAVQHQQQKFDKAQWFVHVCPASSKFFPHLVSTKLVRKQL